MANGGLNTSNGRYDDILYEIKLPNNMVINNGYHVYPSIVGVKQGFGAGNYGGYLWNEDNDLGCIILKKDNNKFHVAIRNYSGNSHDLWLEFTIVDLNKI